MLKFVREKWFDCLPKKFVVNYKVIEAVARRCCVKKVFLDISQNSQENTCARVPFLIKLQASGTGIFL